MWVPDTTSGGDTGVFWTIFVWAIRVLGTFGVAAVAVLLLTRPRRRP